jgi:hypothetical protein
MNWWIWIAALVVYAAFAGWYFNWKGPLTPEEIATFYEKAASASRPSNTDPDVLRQFMESDDGKEFVMLNLVRFPEGEVAHPETGEVTTGPELIAGYFGPFSKALFKRGGHPALMARKRGGHIDSWNAAEDQGFQLVGAMRYRSRRDLVELIDDPQFADGHKFKLAAIDGTTSFPTQVQMSSYLRPSIWVPLAILLIASLAQNAVFLFSLRG